ncbi:replication initiator protein A [Fructilactobacillus sanfranciscensis]|uniref:Uncharacterized protein n=1 Tax=Fructilactobacillus sanfranciscensis TaxID=1625 RepID=A0A5C4TLN1_FRUSA|nr:replication initiator protein A [Fructilactobacillus sanfranciscensis]TNK90905.1 hypothetical protein DID87_02040 [Fructilactobacillus sanfranciscensis]
MKRISIAQVETSETFYQLPKALFEVEPYCNLSLEAKLLYTIMKDRHQLSRKNNWIDNHGFVYIIFTNREAAKTLGCSERKAANIRKELQDAELIEVVSPKSETIKRASHIYIGNLNIDYTAKNSKEKENSQKTVDNSKDNSTGIVKEVSNEKVSQTKSNDKNTSLSFVKEFYERENGVSLKPAQLKLVNDWLNTYDFGVIISSITTAAMNGTSNLKYIFKTIKTETTELEQKIRDLDRQSSLSSHYEV